MAFFSGYLFIYLVVSYLGEILNKRGLIKINFISLMPFAYALVGILYLGLLIKNIYPNYTYENIKSNTHEPFLKIWGLLSILFFIPALSKKPVISLLHSLVFFFFLAKDIFQYFFGTTDKTVLKNDMNIYTNSLLINLAAFTFIALMFFLFTLLNKHKGK